jgi:leucyl aminopeptidase (aminopeptidase T)
MSENSKPNPFEIFYKDFLKLGKRQILTVLTDGGINQGFVDRLVEAGRKDDNIVNVFPINKKPYTEPSNSILMEILKADYVIELAQSTVLYTKAFKKALKCGTKFYFLPGINEREFINTYRELDPEVISKLGRIIFDKINKARKISLQSQDNKKLDMTIGPKRYIPPIFKRIHYSFIRFHSGILNKDTNFTFLPAQVVFRGIRYSINGSLSFDGSIWPQKDMDKLRHPVTFKIKRGSVIDINGGDQGKTIKKMLKKRKIGDGRTVQHFSIGLNPLGNISGNMLIDERASCVLTLGVGHSYSHFDITMSKPTIIIDDSKLIELGKFVEPELIDLSKKLSGK